LAEPVSILDYPGRQQRWAPLLSTKLHVPHRHPDQLTRPRLIEQLHQGLGRRLTLLSAGAGFGKTTLLAEGITLHGRPFAWFSLDRGDNDPNRFWGYFVAALQGVRPGVGEELLASLRAPQPPDLEWLLTALINEIAALPEQFNLVLDDYHLIENETIHRALGFLVENLPEPMHLVIASRADPPLALPRLRARGQLVELRAGDLRFTRDEVAAFLSRMVGLELSTDEVTALESCTEGWGAGLRLAALSLQGREELRAFITSFSGSHRYVLDYLAEEVLHQQPERVQSFLLETSLLDRMSAGLCDAVTQGLDGQAMLERLEQANLFLIPLDDERRWYRYHHLFAEFLRDRLQRSQPESIPELRRRASRWYEANGLLAEAVDCSLATGDHDTAARLMETIVQPTLIQGELTTLTRWLEALPEAIALSSPRLCLVRAWLWMTAGDTESAERWLLSTERVLQELPEFEETRSLRGEIAALRATLAIFHADSVQALEYCHQALESMPSDSPFLQGMVLLNYGLAYDLAGDVAAAGQSYLEANALAEAAGNPLVSLMATAQLGDLHVVRGRLRQAAQYYYRMLDQMSTKMDWPASVAGAHLSIARVLREWDDQEAAAYHLREAAKLGKPLGEVFGLFGDMLMATVKQMEGDPEGALEYIQRSKAKAHGLSQQWGALVDALQVRLWLTQGNLKAAEGWAIRVALDPEETTISYLKEYEGGSMVRLLIAQGRAEEAVALLDRLLPSAESAGRMGSVIEMLALRALALQLEGDLPGALRALKRSLTLAEPEGYVRTFVDEGAPMAALLQRLQARMAGSGEPSASTEAHQPPIRCLSGSVSLLYLRKLLSALGVEPSSCADSPAWEEAAAGLLSDRELEVLRLLVTGKSNEEIARELVITTGTVKRHTHNLYGKLGVQSRAHAIARALETRLLG